MIIIPRRARKDLNTTFLHTMVQGVNKEYIFYKEEYIEKYLEIIAENKKDYDFEVLAYCMMNNHAHFLIYTENMKEFGKFMQKTNIKYAQLYNRNEHRCGVLFRNRYQTEPIYDMKHLINCIKYIHDNPVKAKMVSRCEDYKYSSYKDYANNTGATQSKIMREMFGSKCDYLELFKSNYDKKIMDIENDNIDNKEYILEGIKEFKEKFSYSIVDIFSSREIFKKLIFFLKDECNFKYIEISEFFNISRGTMDILKRR